MPTKVTAHLLDVCMPDFFQGHAGPMVCVSVWPEMTPEQAEPFDVDVLWEDEQVPADVHDGMVIAAVKACVAEIGIGDLTRYMDPTPMDENGDLVQDDLGVIAYFALSFENDEA